MTDSEGGSDECSDGPRRNETAGAVGTQLDACVDVLQNLVGEVHNLDQEKPDSTNQAGLRRRRGERGLEEKPPKLLEGGKQA